MYNDMGNGTFGRYYNHLTSSSADSYQWHIGATFLFVTCLSLPSKVALGNVFSSGLRGNALGLRTAVLRPHLALA